MTEQTVNAIVEWFDGGGEESQGAEHEQHQPQQQQKHQLPRLTQEDMHQQLPPEQQQYYSPLEKSRSLLLLLGPAASPSLLQLAAALFGPAAVAPSFLQQRAADLFGAISFDRLTQQLQKQQQARGTVFAARELLEGHPHVVTPLAEDELLLYSGGYHLGALQVGCGARHCEKEPLPPYAFPLLLAPPTAFAVDGTSKSSNSSQSSYSSSSSSSRMTFASALQTRGNNRALLLSGAWRPFEGHDVQVEYVLGDPLLRLFLQREGESPTFSAEFKVIE
ncbi:hypothetical protein EMWEY_00035540 [Eimeria maxima]|uniref:Uncharacterized protein n=1 Tax=Eimeria maxima TaxID=5804 RepID=U6M9G2_EIMMA|nr:hypothetical protein EMWEY_00035540 [Eimeria maxima]CDJ60862.1 hypothetical protein EMWEY_00035540 [Eimeria maxima]